MATKGQSNLYGTHDNKPSDDINFGYAKDFNKYIFKKHNDDHGEETKTPNAVEYKAKAIRFANTVDQKHCKTFVDKKGSTHKFNKNTNDYVIVDKKGYIVTFHKLKGGLKAFNKHKLENERKRGKKKCQKKK